MPIKIKLRGVDELKARLTEYEYVPKKIDEAIAKAIDREAEAQMMNAMALLAIGSFYYAMTESIR